MNQPSAMLGTFVAIKTMADGTPRLTLDMQCSLADVAAMGLIPGVPFALARLTKEASVAQPQEPVSQPETPKEKPGPLCVLACQFCADPMFWKWINACGIAKCSNEQEAKKLVLADCDIQSRKELDSNSEAANLFHQYIRKPFMAWRDANPLPSTEPKRREAA